MAWPYVDIQTESQSVVGIKERVYPRTCTYWQTHVKYQVDAMNQQDFWTKGFLSSSLEFL